MAESKFIKEVFSDYKTTANIKDAKILKIPVYHFHDGFLKYTSILRKKYPKTLRKIKVEDEQITKRFIQASRGWIKYKPLFQYITHKETYKEKIQETYEKLKTGIIEVNKLFENEDCNVLLEDLTKYDKNVKKHYNEYLKTNEIWDKLKSEI